MKLKKLYSSILLISLGSTSFSLMAQQYQGNDLSPQIRPTIQSSNSSSQSQNSNRVSSAQSGQQQAPQVIEYEYPDIPADLTSLDKELMLYDDEKRAFDGQERLLLMEIYQEEQLEETRAALKRLERRRAIESAYGDVSQYPPETITNLRRYEQTIDKAYNQPLEDVDQIFDSKEIDMASARPIDVFVAEGNQATVVFMDRAGNPWPIAGEPHYDQNSFSITTTHEKNHIALFTLKRPFTQSNATINLKGLDMPIIIRLIGSENKVHSRLALRMPSFGPEMKSQPQVYSMVNNVSEDMLSVLNGDDLSGAYQYDIEGVPDADAYYKDGKLYIRTKELLLIPAPLEASALPSGYKAYTINAKRDLMFSVDGRRVHAHVKKKRSINLEKQDSVFTQN